MSKTLNHLSLTIQKLYQNNWKPLVLLRKIIYSPLSNKMVFILINLEQYAQIIPKTHNATAIENHSN